MSRRLPPPQATGRVFLALCGLGLIFSSLPSATAQTSVCAPLRSIAYEGFVPSFPHPSDDPTLTADVTRGYRQLFALRRRDAARATLREARAAAESKDNICAEALAVYALAIDAESTSFKDAGELYSSALSLFNRLQSTPGIAEVHFHLGRVEATRGNTTESIRNYTLAAGEFQALGDVSSSLITRLGMGRAQKHADFAGLLEEAHAHSLPCVEAQIHQFWADAIHTSSHFDEAMEHDKAADLLYSQCPRDKDQRAAVQTSMGRMERQQGRPLVALEHYRIALRLQRESGDLSYLPQTYNAMAVAYENMGNSTEAIALLRRGLDAAQAIHSQPFIEFLEANLGATYARSGHASLGIPLLLRSTEHLANDYLRCVRFRQLATAYLNAGDNLNTVKVMGTALPACRSQHNNEQIMSGLEDLSRAELALHREDDALRDAREGLALVEETRAHLVPEDAYKQGFITQNRHLYDTAIAALSQLNRPAEALEIAEQARARAFLDLLGSHQAASGALLATPPLPRKELLQSPERVAPLTSDAILAATAHLHSTLLAYWSSPTRLYIWVAQPGQPLLEVTQPITSDRLAQLVMDTHRTALSTVPDTRTWRSLYQVLIAPVESALPKTDGDLLTIVPSGPLFSLTFAALRAPGGNFLVERFRTHTIATVGLLAFTERNATAAAEITPHFLFVANPLHLPPGADGHPLPSLPGTAEEVRQIASLMPAGQTTRLEGRKASIAPLTQALPGSTILHLATHAVLNDQDPNASFLALDDSEHAGKLTVTDIYGLHLHTTLVVLSACRSGLGKITGDGVAGLSRAFIYAGSASVLSTSWDVADQPTALLLPRFYAALDNGESASAALRTGQLSMLADLRHHRIRIASLSGRMILPPDPAYWATFSLSGQP